MLYIRSVTISNELAPSDTVFLNLRRCAEKSGGSGARNACKYDGENCIHIHQGEPLLSNRENFLMFPHYWPCVFGAVFLGGSCNPTSWRKDIVIPRLLKEGISFYNPVSLLSLSLL